MRYINKKTKELIIEIPIDISTTKIKAKDGTIKHNIKYVARIPDDILIFMLEKFKPFDPVSDINYIDDMIKEKVNDKPKYYLTFYNSSGRKEIQITNHKLINDDAISVRINKLVASNSYVFTVSKKVFSELNNIPDCSYSFRFILDLDCDSDCFKNSVVYVELV